MNRISDIYSAVGGSAVEGRCFNPRLGRWETLVGGVPTAPQMTSSFVRAVDIKLTDAAGLIKQGVVVRVYLLVDPSHPAAMIPLFAGVTSRRAEVFWHGCVPMLAGILWLVRTPGLDATDLVTFGVNYE